MWIEWQPFIVIREEKTHFSCMCLFSWHLFVVWYLFVFGRTTCDVMISDSGLWVLTSCWMFSIRLLKPIFSLALFPVLLWQLFGWVVFLLIVSHSPSCTSSLISLLWGFNQLQGFLFTTLPAVVLPTAVHTLTIIMRSHTVNFCVPTCWDVMNKNLQVKRFCLN